MKQNPPQEGTLLQMYRTYWQLEVFALTFSFCFALMKYQETQSYTSAAIAGTIGEMIGFYGSGFIRQVWRFSRNQCETRGWKRCPALIGLALRAMAIEHGVAGFLDDFCIRPITLWAMPQLLIWAANAMIHGTIPFGSYACVPAFGFGVLALRLPLFKIGIVSGKIIADLIFYRISLEFRRRFHRHIC